MRIISWTLLAALLVITSTAQSESKIKINPWKELFRPNCVGEECLDSDYKEHKKKQKQIERERERAEKERRRAEKRAEREKRKAEKRAERERRKAERREEKRRRKEQRLLARERQKAYCRENSRSGTAHSTAQCR